MVGKRTTVLELLACKDETLLVRGDALLALDLLLDFTFSMNPSRAHLFKVNLEKIGGKGHDIGNFKALVHTLER
eukprot:g40922.t1